MVVRGAQDPIGAAWSQPRPTRAMRQSAPLGKGPDRQAIALAACQQSRTSEAPDLMADLKPLLDLHRPLVRLKNDPTTHRGGSPGPIKTPGSQFKEGSSGTILGFKVDEAIDRAICLVTASHWSSTASKTCSNVAGIVNHDPVFNSDSS